jgi:hypothetical protein
MSSDRKDIEDDESPELENADNEISCWSHSEETENSNLFR